MDAGSNERIGQPRRYRRRRFLTTGGVGFAALASAAALGCGEEKDRTGRTTSATAVAATAAAATAATAVAAATAKRGGTFRTPGTGGDPPHLDVHQTASNVLAAFGPGIAY